MNQKILYILFGIVAWAIYFRFAYLSFVKRERDCGVWSVKLVIYFLMAMCAFFIGLGYVTLCSPEG